MTYVHPRTSAWDWWQDPGWQSWEGWQDWSSPEESSWAERLGLEIYETWVGAFSMAALNFSIDI